MRTILTLDALLCDYVNHDYTRYIEDIDFTVEADPSLKRIDNYNIRGLKDFTEYRSRDRRQLVVKKEFIENIEDSEIDIIFTWFNREGEVFATKTKIVDMHDEGKWEARFRKQRERIFDDLKGKAKKYNVENYINILYSYLKEEKEDFIETGSLMFANKVQETLLIDTSALTEKEQLEIGTIQAILNNSLDGEDKVYETLTYLTTL